MLRHSLVTPQPCWVRGSVQSPQQMCFSVTDNAGYKFVARSPSESEFLSDRPQRCVRGLTVKRRKQVGFILPCLVSLRKITEMQEAMSLEAAADLCLTVILI